MIVNPVSHTIEYHQAGVVETIELNAGEDAAHFAFHMICEDQETKFALLYNGPKDTAKVVSQYQKGLL